MTGDQLRKLFGQTSYLRTRVSSWGVKTVFAVVPLDALVAMLEKRRRCPDCGAVH